MTTSSRTAVHLAHTVHADSPEMMPPRIRPGCPLCSQVGPSRVTWDEAKELLHPDGKPR